MEIPSAISAKFAEQCSPANYSRRGFGGWQHCDRPKSRLIAI
jgi:hypothetical protein